MSGIGEALSAPGSIAGLISLGIEVAKLLYSVADGISTAGEEVRAVALEVDMYTKTMEAIQEVVERQEQVAPSITVVIDRLVGICRPIFQTYKDMQKRLAPLLKTFRNSRRKLEQVNLRFAWYFKTKKEVYGYRSALKRQFSLLTPILTALAIDQGGNPTQHNYHIHNVQVRVILQNSVESVRALHSPHGNRLSEFYPAEGAGLALLVASNDSGLNEGLRESPRTETASEIDNETGDEATLSDTLNNRLALVNYHPPREPDDQTLSPGEVDEINQQVERALDEGIKNVSNGDVFEIILETYSVEKQFIRLISQILAGLSARYRVPPDPMQPPQGSSPEIHETKNQSGPATSDVDKGTVFFALSDKLSYRFPYGAVRDVQGLVNALISVGFTFKRSINGTAISPTEQVRDLLNREKMFLTDSTGNVIMPDHWSRSLQPGMTVKLQSMTTFQNKRNWWTEHFVGGLQKYFER